MLLEHLLKKSFKSDTSDERDWRLFLCARMCFMLQGLEGSEHLRHLFLMPPLDTPPLPQNGEIFQADGPLESGGRDLFRAFLPREGGGLCRLPQVPHFKEDSWLGLGDRLTPPQESNPGHLANLLH